MIASQRSGSPRWKASYHSRGMVIVSVFVSGTRAPLRGTFEFNQYTQSNFSTFLLVAKAPASRASAPTADTDCTPPDSIDALVESGGRTRPELDFEPVAIITRLARLRR